MSETVPIWQHHGIVNVAMQDGSRESACMCQLTDDDVEIVEGCASHVGEMDDDCPHKERKTHIDGEEFASALERYRVDSSRRRGL